MRKPVTSFKNNVGNIVVLCDDGTAWGYAPRSEDESSTDSHSWVPLNPPLPGSAAAEEEELPPPFPSN